MTKGTFNQIQGGLNEIEYITLKDVYRAGYCRKGVQYWCEQHNYSWDTMIHIGYPLEQAAALNEEIVNHIIRVKREQSNGRK